MSWCVYEVFGNRFFNIILFVEYFFFTKPETKGNALRAYAIILDQHQQLKSEYFYKKKKKLFIRAVDTYIYTLLTCDGRVSLFRPQARFFFDNSS